MIGWDEYFRHFPNGALQQSSMWIRSSEIHDWGFSDKGWDMKYIFQTWYVISNHETYFPIMKYIFQTWNISFKHEISQNIHSKHQQRPIINIKFFCSLTTKKSNRVETPFFSEIFDNQTEWHTDIKVIKDLTMGSTPGCLNVEHDALYFLDDLNRDPNMNNKEHRVG